MEETKRRADFVQGRRIPFSIDNGFIMLLGKIIGTVVSTIKYEGLEGVPLLLVQPLDKNQNPHGKPFVACDATKMAGPGELIYYEGGREAALALDPWFVPVDHTIIGIVDGVHLTEEDKS